MPTLRFFDNWSPAWSEYTGSGPDNVEVGTPFTLANAVQIVEFSWYRGDTTPAHKPENLRLWDLTSHTAILSAPSVPDNGAVGWQRVACDPFQINPGHLYCVTQYVPTGAARALAVTSGAVGPTSPLGAGDFTRRYHGGGLGEPTSADDAFYEGVDLGVVDLGPSAGTGGGTTSGDLASWLSADGTLNGHQTDGLPWLTKEQLDDVHKFLFGTSPYAANGVLPSLQTLLIAASTAVSLVTGLQTLLRPGGVGPSSAVVDDTGRSVLAAVNDLVNPINTIARAVQGTSGLTVFPAAPWAKQDEVDFEFQKSWDVPADLYTLSTTGIPEYIDTADVDGAIWRPRLGWWAPRNGDLFGTRRFVDWPTQILEDAGRRMPGVLVRTQYGASCHLEAWTLG